MSTESKAVTSRTSAMELSSHFCRQPRGVFYHLSGMQSAPGSVVAVRRSFSFNVLILGHSE